MPLPLPQYLRTTTPELEAAPRRPMVAVDLTSPVGVPFTLVREATAADGALAWLVWRERACVGVVAANVWNSGTVGDPFAPTRPYAPYRTAAAFRRTPRAVGIWRTWLADGSRTCHAAEALDPVPSRGLGIMTSAYLEIIRQLSAHGFALGSYPNARSAAAARLWRRIATTPSLTLVSRRPPGGEPTVCAFMAAAG